METGRVQSKNISLLSECSQLDQVPTDFVYSTKILYISFPIQGRTWLARLLDKSCFDLSTCNQPASSANGFCDGTLVGDGTWILTAAHCLFDTAVLPGNGEDVCVAIF